MQAPISAHRAFIELQRTIEDAGGSMPCMETDPELFFVEIGVPAAKAKALCQTCPIINQCRDYAVWHFELHGVWGGTSPTERERIREMLRIKPRADRSQSLEYWLEHWRWPESSHPQSEQQPECLEADLLPHQ